MIIVVGVANSHCLNQSCHRHHHHCGCGQVKLSGTDYDIHQ